MKKTLKMLQEDSGAALMMAIFTVTMLMVIATEVMYETNVEFVVSSQNVNQVRAHYAAKAGVEIGLLRLHIYKKVLGMMGSAASQVPMIDMIWKMPFAWPPIVPEDTNSVDKSQIKAKVKTSTMQGTYLSTIDSEGNKIDLSLLANDNPVIVNAVVGQLLAIFTTLVQNDQKFADKHSGEDFQKLVNNIKDYVDADDKSDNGGDEKSLYQNINTQTVQYPPNQPFKTFDELHMVAGMTDEYFDILMPKVTIYGSKSLNVKYAARDLLMAAFNLKPEQADQLIAERDKQDSSIKDEKTFLAFLENLGLRKEDLIDSKTNQPKVNIICQPEFNFRVRSTGSSGKVSREITAIVFDYAKVLAQLKSLQPQPTPTATPPTGQVAAGPTTTPTPTPTPGGQDPTSNDRPNIVYWNEH